MKLLFFCLYLFSQALLADDQGKVISGYDPRADIISENYEAGAYLIYDCKEQHWVCVLESYYLECETKRKDDLKDPENPYHSCAPIGAFPVKRSCFERQAFLTTHNAGNRFCLKDEFKKKAIDL